MTTVPALTPSQHDIIASLKFLRLSNLRKSWTLSARGRFTLETGLRNTCSYCRVSPLWCS